MQHFLDDLLSGDLAERAVIAGGFAACPALASDIDVWVLDCVSPEETRDEIIKCWYVTGRMRVASPMMSKITLEPDNHSLIQGREHSAGYGATKEWQICRVGTVELLNSSKPFHILTTDCTSAFELVETFDISTHAVAFSPTTMHVTHGSKWTKLTEPPQKLRDTPTTAERLVKICGRYGQPNNYVGLRDKIRRTLG